MSHRFEVRVSEAAFNKNAMCYAVVSEILRAQSQPIVVCDGDASGLTFELRVNLSRQQFDRLIKKEISASLPWYGVEVDWGSRKMRVSRVDKAKRKPAATQKQASADSDIGDEPI